MLHQPTKRLRADGVSNFAVNRCRGAIVAVQVFAEILPHVAICPEGRAHDGGEGEPKEKESEVR